jgi:hypothetical protein
METRGRDFGALGEGRRDRWSPSPLDGSGTVGAAPRLGGESWLQYAEGIARCDAAAVIRESIGITSHLSLLSFGYPALKVSHDQSVGKAE